MKKILVHINTFIMFLLTIIFILFIELQIELRPNNIITNLEKINYYQKGKEINKELLIKEIETLKQSIEKRKKLLSNENYTNKAPKNVVDLDRQKLKEEEKKLKHLETQI